MAAKEYNFKPILTLTSLYLVVALFLIPALAISKNGSGDWTVQSIAVQYWDFMKERGFAFAVVSIVCGVGFGALRGFMLRNSSDNREI